MYICICIYVYVYMYTCIHVSMYICVYIYRLLCDRHSWIVREANDGCKAFYAHSPFGYLMRLPRVGGIALHSCLSCGNSGIVNTAAHLAVAFRVSHAPASAREALQQHTRAYTYVLVGRWVGVYEFSGISPVRACNRSLSVCADAAGL